MYTPSARWIGYFVLLALSPTECAKGAFEIVVTYNDPTAFSDAQLELMDAALADATGLWERVIRGYSGSSTESILFPVEIFAEPTDRLAAASPRNTFLRDGFRMSGGGNLWMNAGQIEPAATGFGIADHVNFLDELLAHEIGHALGIGTLWEANGVYVHGSGAYRGPHGLTAYRDEFDSQAEFIEVELAGGPGSANSHWNQLFRSSPEEGDPGDPFALSPLTGIMDRRGRDFAQDLMSPALDPDYGEPFLSNTTVQSLRDIGYDVVAVFPPDEDFNADGAVDAADAAFMFGNWGLPGLADLTMDGLVDAADAGRLFAAWTGDSGLRAVPEPRLRMAIFWLWTAWCGLMIRRGGTVHFRNTTSTSCGM